MGMTSPLETSTVEEADDEGEPDTSVRPTRSSNMDTRIITRETFGMVIGVLIKQEILGTEKKARECSRRW